MQVHAILDTSVGWCIPSTAVQDAAVLAAAQDAGHIVIVDDPQHLRPVSLLGPDDLVAAYRARVPAWAPVGECFPGGVVTVSADLEAYDCLDLMDDLDARAFPVTDRCGALCGLITRRALERSLLVPSPALEQLAPARREELLELTA